jgi:hypothetical protein
MLVTLTAPWLERVWTTAIRRDPAGGATVTGGRGWSTVGTELAGRRPIPTPRPASWVTSSASLLGEALPDERR